MQVVVFRIDLPCTLYAHVTQDIQESDAMNVTLGILETCLRLEASASGASATTTLT